MRADFEEFRGYVTHLRTEHRRLRECLHRIEQQWGQQHQRSGRRDDMPPLIESLEALCAELAHHFAQEESGGCLEEAVSHQPSLSREAIRLEREHPELLGRLERLIVRLRQPSRLGASVDKMDAEFRSFAKDLRAHEAGENRLVEKSFGIKVE